MILTIQVRFYEIIQDPNNIRVLWLKAVSGTQETLQNLPFQGLQSQMPTEASMQSLKNKCDKGQVGPRVIWRRHIFTPKTNLVSTTASDAMPQRNIDPLLPELIIFQEIPKSWIFT